MQTNQVLQLPIGESIYLCAAMATIVLVSLTLLRNLRGKDKDPIEVFLSDYHGNPCPDVRLEGECGPKNPDKDGRVFMNPKYLGTWVRVYDPTNGQLLTSVKLEAVRGESFIRIVVR